jgi:hypothetical protein
MCVAGKNCFGAIGNGVLVLGGTLPDRVPHDQVRALSDGCRCHLHCPNDIGQNTLLGASPSTPLWLHRGTDYVSMHAPEFYHFNP